MMAGISREDLIIMLMSERTRWEVLLSEAGEERILSQELPERRSIKDVIAHLTAWQRRSLARLQAAQHGELPGPPEWPQSLTGTEEINQWIFATYRDRPLPDILREWQDVFQELIDLGRVLPEELMMEPGRFDWMEGEALLSVIRDAYVHSHNEHLVPLRSWLAGHKSIRNSQRETAKHSEGLP